jgi:hypothetical protein
LPFAEVGWVYHFDFQEKHVGAGRDRVVAALLAFLGRVVARIVDGAGTAAFRVLLLEH